MGACTSKPPKPNPYSPQDILPPPETPNINDPHKDNNNETTKKSPFSPFYSPSPARYFLSKKSPARHSSASSKSVNSTPARLFKRPFPPPSPAKHIKALLLRRHGSVKPNAAAIPEGEESEGANLDRSFGFSKQFTSKYEIGEEVGRGHFGYTCSAIVKKGELKGQQVAVKVIPKAKTKRSWVEAVCIMVTLLTIETCVPVFPRTRIALDAILHFISYPLTADSYSNFVVFQMTTAISIEDVRREVKILRALTGHNNLIQFYDAFEDRDNVYVVMELCQGGELLDRILARGGKYSEEDAKDVMVQILNVVAFCHLQGVVHRDLKPEEVMGSSRGNNLWQKCKNFLFSSKDESSQLKAIDFGLSDFVRPDEKLNDIVGSAYYVAPEILHRSYGIEADVWSIGVIAYILLCGSRPFWARTESGIFRAVLKADPTYDEAPWTTLTSEAKDFVKRLLNKDPRKRMSAAQALCHPWMSNHIDAKLPLDILIFRLMKAYMRSSSLRKAALRALSKTLTADELFYLKEQFALLEPDKFGSIKLENIKSALMKYGTDAMRESRIPDFLASLNALQYRKMDFEEFCSAALSVHQLEALERWEQHARCAYEFFDKDGNRAIVIEELASELGLGPSIPVHTVLHDWIRHTDGKLSFLGFVKLLHGPSTLGLAKVQ
ncbi:hypothetical protein RND71_041719 [Anisodus tanguticus]|uniref:Protein kinase domain-containing protein n=1 Tax=Anisodus tanguticus TaxID=243964 RepID=A0AAE1QXY4_9SOLA|nr:hypothetical protein RND71_041719 [Anisodus tanguticus]